MADNPSLMLTNPHISYPEFTEGLPGYAKVSPSKGTALKMRNLMKEEVEEVLESVRPMLIQDGGNVELVDIDDGVVKVRLVGACVSCSSSTMTLKMGIEKALKKAIPMVRCVEAVD
jgi:Fe-S cluster biogenesis protein NfuA